MERSSEMGGRERVVAVAVDRDKSSIYALKWAITHIVTRHETLRLLHVKDRFLTGQQWGMDQEQSPDALIAEMMLPLKCYCMRKEVNCETVVLEDSDVAKAIVEYIGHFGVKILLLGTPSKTGISRLFRSTDIPSTVMKWAPDFCTVYVIAKGKVSSARNSSRSIPSPHLPPLSSSPSTVKHPSLTPSDTPYRSIKRVNGRSYDNLDYELLLGGMSDARLSVDQVNSLKFYDTVQDSSRPSRATRADVPPNWEPSRNSSYVDCREDFEPSITSGFRMSNGHTSTSTDDRSSWEQEDYERQMKRLETELKQTMDMYHAACKEALAAKRKAMEVEKWKVREEKRIEEARELEQKVGLIVEKEKERIKIEANEAAQRFVEAEVEKRVNAEIDAIRGFEEMQADLNGLDSLGQSLLVLKYKSLYHIVSVLFLFYFYFSVSSW
ncbi:unnamed protein product [Linum tenue]|uniref:RING-type E3 ubiquitin transferase n=1 Tax=Linum tenue TaxID=586396 RepID=A0AAV0HPG1_9ROSI|nr:unnamed protein product [Linum tenue]